jgi:hypothetical protein
MTERSFGHPVRVGFMRSRQSAAAAEAICSAIVELGREHRTRGHLECPFLRRRPGSPA